MDIGAVTHPQHSRICNSETNCIMLNVFHVTSKFYEELIKMLKSLCMGQSQICAF